MANVANELVIPVSKYPHKLALPILIPQTTLPPQSAIWNIIILISLNCISKGLDWRKAVFLSGRLHYAVSLPAPQRASTGGGNMTAVHPPPPLPAFLSAPSFPPTHVPLFSFHIFLPHQFLHPMCCQTYKKKTEILTMLVESPVFFLFHLSLRDLQSWSTFCFTEMARCTSTTDYAV